MSNIDSKTKYFLFFSIVCLGPKISFCQNGQRSQIKTYESWRRGNIEVFEIVLVVSLWLKKYTLRNYWSEYHRWGSQFKDLARV